METPEKLAILKSMRLLAHIPERQLALLGEFLTPAEFADGAVIFEEGERGESLYFMVSGQVRISKRISADETKDLAVLSPGDCFGEMALVDEVARSARATASGPVKLWQLHRQDLQRWIKAHPELAVDFFSHLVQTLSQRLRRTSSELTLVFDLSHRLLETWDSGQDLLSEVLEHVVPHLEGSWSAAAHLYNAYNDEMDFVAGCGSFDFSALRGKLPPLTETRNLWVDEQSFYVSLPGPKRPHGYLIFHCADGLTSERRAEAHRALTTVAHLVTSALENINHRIDASLRDRLKRQTSHGAYF